MKTTKFQADLTNSDFIVLQSLMEDMEVRSKADFLAKAIYFIRWALTERKLGHKIVTVGPEGSVQRELVTPELERVAPQLVAKSIVWTPEEVRHFSEMTSQPQPEPSEHLVRALRSKR